MSPWLLTLHLIAACAHIGASTHHLCFAWQAHRREAGWRRAQRHGRITLITGVVALGLGAALYPEYKVHIRGPWLEAAAPDGVRAFDLKEHLVAVALAAHWGAWILVRGGREALAERGPRGLYLSLVSLGTALVWIGGLIGAGLVSWQSAQH